MQASSLSSLRLPDYKKLALIAVVGIAAVTAGMYRELSARPVYEYHDVKVVKVIEPYVWILAKEDGMFRAVFCRDYDLPSLGEPVPGNVLSKIRYEDKGDCVSIQKADLGLWWARDPHTGKAVIEN